MKRQLYLLVFILFFLLYNGVCYAQTLSATRVVSTITSTPGVASTTTQGFTVSATNLTGPVTINAPLYFEVSSTAIGPFSKSIVLSPPVNFINNAVVFARSDATAPEGIISGNVTITTPGAAAGVDVLVYGTIMTTVTSIPNQSLDHGALTAPVNFGANWGCTYTWVNNTATIGLPASGAGNISPFAAVNTGAGPVTATITASPVPTVYAYIGNNNSPIVTIVNTVSNTVEKTWNLGTNSDGLSMNANSFAISADGKTVYAASSSANALAVIDAATGVVLKRHLNLAGVTSPILSNDGRYVYAALSGSSTVLRMQTSDNVILNYYTVGSGPTGLTISADGANVYCANSISKTVSIINTSSAVSTPITLSETPGYMVIQDNVDGRFLYIATSKGVDIVDLTNNQLTKTITMAGGVKAITIRPDGNKVYVTRPSVNSVTPINTRTQLQETPLPSSTGPESVGVSADNQRLYIVNSTSGSVAVYNTVTFDQVVTFNLGSTGSASYGGNFISSMVNCTGGSPFTFTITINPLAASGTTATITTGAPTGNIISCAGSISGPPNISQFTFTGTNLTGNITLTAPAGFEISPNPVTGYNTVITAVQSGGSAAGIIYVRAAANAPAGTIFGLVSLTTAGATETRAVTGTVQALGSVNLPANQNFTALGISTPINFTGTFTSVTWANNTPGIGLPATGTGNIPAFTPTNPGSTPLVATISVTPNNSNGCPASPVSFLITVAPAAAQTVTLTGPIAQLTTVYGTASALATFTIAVTNSPGTITVTAPAGFELSFNNVSFTNVITIPNSGTLPTTTVYVRISKTTPAGAYSGNVGVTGGGFARQIELATGNLVTKAPLTVTVDNKTRILGTPDPAFTYIYSGFVNNEDPSVITTPPAVSTTAIQSSSVGQYPITASGGTAANYSFSYVGGTLEITEVTDIIVKNTFTPNGDGFNDTWEIENIEGHPKSVVEVYNRYGVAVFKSLRYSTSWDGKRKGADVPAGMYYYIIDLKDGSKPVRGWLTVLR